MKKAIVLVLLLAMLLPTGLVNFVGSAGVDTKPFYFVNNIGELETGAYKFDDPYVYSRVNFSASKYKGSGDLPIYINLNTGYSANKVVRDIPSMAQTLKEIFADRPVGTRYIMLYKTIDANVLPEAMIYMDKGVALYAQWAEAFFKEFKAIGGQLDGILLDMEYNYTHAHYLKKIYKTGATVNDIDIPATPEIYKEIVEHPLYATDVRPLLEERGFHFIQGSGNKSEIFNINDSTSADAQIWNAVMRERQVAYMKKAIAPALKYFPDVMVTNYGFSASKAWNVSVDAEGGNMVSAGTTANENYYVRQPAYNMDRFNVPTTYNGTYYEDSVFNSFLYEINQFKGMYDSSDTKRISAFVSGFNYQHRIRPTNGTRNTPYYSETILHIGMLNPEVFLGYIVGPRDTTIEGEPYDYDDVIQVVSQLMSELTRVAGYADRKALAVPKTWNSSFVLSGMYAGGRNIWRLTPDTAITTREDFKVKGKDPTFRINGQTITFPGGKIIEDGNISHIGTCGYWVETAANVTPVITSDANRYSQFPAFEENFDGYSTGMTYSNNNVKIPTSWKINTAAGAKAVIEADKRNAGNQVLALTGNVQLLNVNVLKNITAGDTYAKQQTCEVTVTLPANMGAENITLLYLENDKGLVIDGGFRIAGGKVSYSKANTYVEMAGVDVSAGGKFTFKRTMNFSSPGAYTCDYTICDAAGNELAAVKDVSMAANVALPLHAMGLNFTNINGTVYVDDYKLYASGVAADFMLYDEKTGIRVAEPDKARSANTAFRASWLNGTAYEKVYSVVAAFYNGSRLTEEKVIRTIKMAPNTDAVETGVVEVKNGQSVRIYLRNDSKPESGGDVNVPGNSQPGNSKPESGGDVNVPDNTLPDNSKPESGDATNVPDNTQTEPGDDVNNSTDTKSGKGNTGMLIAIIAGAVLLAAAGAAAVVFIKKKQATSAAKSENTAAPEDKSAE